MKENIMFKILQINKLNELNEVLPQLNELNEVLPQKERKISSDDQPFCTEKMKHFKPLKSREYQKNRRSLKYLELSEKYKKEVLTAKKSYYKNAIKDLKTSNVSQWYSKLKRLCSYDQKKSEI